MARPVKSGAATATRLRRTLSSIEAAALAGLAAATPTRVVHFGDRSTPDQTTVVVAHALRFGLLGLALGRC